MSRIDWKPVRIDVWRALETDDDGMLADILQGVADTAQSDIGAVIDRLSLKLWRSEKGKCVGSKGTGRVGVEYQPTGLLEVCSGNKGGIPPDGAIRCARWLLSQDSVMWGEDEVKWSKRHAERLGRTEIYELLMNYFP